jgi:predicted transcriptional regulator
MKTAISVPDDIFNRAEALAKRQGRSRSEVYSTAVREYVARHSPDDVTERAATLIGIAESLLAKAGGEWPADEREQYEGTLATLSAGLSAADLDRARASGAAMSLDDGTAFGIAVDQEPG